MSTQEKPLWKDWRLHFMVLLASVIAEIIGARRVPLGRFSFTLAPLIFSMLLMTLFYIWPKQNIIGEKNVKNATSMMSIAGGLLLAKLGVSSGAQLQEMISAGIPATLQNLGEGMSALIALPLAMLLGMGRESIGMTFGVSREANVALITDKYGGDSAEFRGVMTNYIVGTIFGVISVSLLMSILAEIPFFSPESLSLATGIGSASMMVGGLGTLIEKFPDQAQTLEAYAAVSNLVSSVVGIYVALFMGLPITEWLYKKLSPKAKNKKEAK